MDKEHKVLNALLDEIDLLEAQLQEALADQDYELAHLLQEALLLKCHVLYELEKVFIPVQRRRWPPAYRFVVSDTQAPSVLSDHLKAFLQKDTDILALQLRFKNKTQKESLERISMYRNPLTLAIHMVLTKPDPVYFQKAFLHDIGWERDQENAQRFLYAMQSSQKYAFHQLKLIIARTLFEVIDKYEIRTELKIVRVSSPS